MWLFHKRKSAARHIASLEPTPLSTTESERESEVPTDRNQLRRLNMLPHFFRSIISVFNICHPRTDSYVYIYLRQSRKTLEGVIWEHKDTFWSSSLSWIILVLLLWILLYSILREAMSPRGDVFRLLFMIIAAYLFGQATELLKLPGLLGMLVTGLVLRNIGFYYPAGGEYKKLSQTMKQLATTCGMIRAGLRLVPDAIYSALYCHQGKVLLGLGMAPSFLEAMVTAFLAYYIFQYPIPWALCLGFLLCPNSPSVITPPMIELMKNGYGEDKNIGVLVNGAAGLDVAISVTVFDLCVSLLLRHETLEPNHLIIEGFLDVGVDIFGGFLLGVIIGFLPVQHDSWARWKRTVAIMAGGMIPIVCGPEIGLPGTGPLCSIITGFIASTLWKLQVPLNTDKSVNDIIQGIWIVVSPMLFGFTGSDVDINTLDWYTVGRMLVVVLTSVFVRMFGCFIVLSKSGLNCKEALFVGLIFQGKATNQAALGTQILNLAWESHADDDLQKATETVTMGVLSILICTPIAHLGAKWAGPCLLTKYSTEQSGPSSQSPRLIRKSSERIDE